MAKKKVYSERMSEHLKDFRKTDVFKEFDGPHARSHRSPEARRKPYEVTLNEKWNIESETNIDEVLENAIGDFCDFMHTCMKEDIKREAKRGKKKIVLSLNPRTKNKESHCIVVEKEKIHISGGSSVGLMYALFHLEWLMGLREGPYLSLGTITRSPAVKYRHMDGFYGLDDTEKRISLMAHFGANTIGAPINSLTDYSTSTIIPELKSAQYQNNIAKLKREVSNARRYGIKVILPVFTVCKFKDDEPIFKKYPDIKGSKQWREKGGHSLCTSSPRVRDFYIDILQNIFQQVPDLGGIMALVGGEGFYHCYMRPYQNRGGGFPRNTDCPVCNARKPEEVVSELVNSVAKGVWKVNKEAEIVIWPYSAYVWSSDYCQKEFISKLLPGITLLTCIDKDEIVQKDGFDKDIWDYSIDFIGPSKRFLEQKRIARKHGLKLWVKTDSETSLEFYQIPHIPCLYRWAKRAKVVNKQKPDGVLPAMAIFPNFYSQAMEVSMALLWEPSPAIEDLFSAIIIRDFGKQAVKGCKKAWRYFSEAMEYCPQISPCGYWKGPIYLGAANPLIFQLEELKKLSKIFNRTSNGFYLPGKDATVEEPTCVELFPYNVCYKRGEREPIISIVRYWKKMAEIWGKGVNELDKCLAGIPAEKIGKVRREFAVAKQIWLSIKEMANFGEWFMVKEQFIMVNRRLDYSGIYQKESRKMLKQMYTILNNELDNAKMGLEILKDNPALDLWFDRDGEMAHSQDLLQAKIAHTKYLLQEGIPEFMKNHGMDKTHDAMQKIKEVI